MTVSFVIFDASTGTILKSVNISGAPSEVEAMMETNTPSGASALSLPAGQIAPVASAYKVVTGTIVSNKTLIP